MAREASETSVSPAQNSLKPSPVPGPSTEISTLPFWPMKSSATRAVMGSTVDEPEMVIEPSTEVSAEPPVVVSVSSVLTEPSSSSFALQAPSIRPGTTRAAVNAARCFLEITGALLGRSLSG